jgi:hypothetical protein
MQTQPRITYLPLIDAFEQYVERHKSQLSHEAKSATGEILARLARLDRQYTHLLNLNQALREVDPMSLTYDETTGTFHGDLGDGKKHEFRIPGIAGPLKLVAAVDIAAFDSGAPVKHLGPEHAALRMELEERIEAYYYGAHRLTVLVRTLPDQKRFSCREMIVVRNDLLEHTKEESSYNFGYGTGGPVVRPVRPAGSSTKDLGAVANTTAYVAALAAVFNS